MIADVVDIDRLGLAVFDPCDDVSNAGAAFGGLAEVAGVWQDGFQEL